MAIGLTKQAAFISAENRYFNAGAMTTVIRKILIRETHQTGYSRSVCNTHLIKEMPVLT